MSKIQSDAQSDLNNNFEALQFVGMTAVQSAIQMQDLVLGKTLMIPAEIEMGVDLKSGHRGIHMSRLYQVLMTQIAEAELDERLIQKILIESLKSQDEISLKSYLNISFQFPKTTTSLKSNIRGYRNYPIILKSFFSEKKQFSMEIVLKILYSSTCPQSLRLSKEYIRDNYSSQEIYDLIQKNDSFWPATPHAQKSEMTLHLQVQKMSKNVIDEWIDLVENALQTPVQTAVKKADEMEFARLNGHSAMFCEDALRIVARKLVVQESIHGFRIETTHQESLHPHNAKSVIEHQYLKH